MHVDVVENQRANVDRVCLLSLEADTFQDEMVLAVLRSLILDGGVAEVTTNAGIRSTLVIPWDLTDEI